MAQHQGAHLEQLDAQRVLPAARLLHGLPDVLRHERHELRVEQRLRGRLAALPVGRLQRRVHQHAQCGGLERGGCAAVAHERHEAAQHGAPQLERAVHADVLVDKRRVLLEHACLRVGVHVEQRKVRLHARPVPQRGVEQRHEERRGGRPGVHHVRLAPPVRGELGRVPERQEPLGHLAVLREPGVLVAQQLPEQQERGVHLRHVARVREQRPEVLRVPRGELPAQVPAALCGEREAQQAQQASVAQAARVEEEGERVLREPVEERHERLGEGRRAHAVQVLLNLRHARGEPREELVRRVRQQVEHTHDGRERAQLLVRLEGAARGTAQHGGLREAAQVVQQLHADLHLEVVGEQLEQAREAVEPGGGEPVAVREGHEDRLQPAAEQVLGQLALLRQRHLEAVVRHAHNLLRVGVEALEVDRDDPHAHRHVLLCEEVAAAHRRGEQPDGGDPELGDHHHVLVQRRAAHQRLVVRVGKRQGLGEHPEELLVELGQRLRQRERVGDRVDVPDLHPERQRAQRLGEDGHQQPVPLRHEQLRHRALLVLRQAGKRALRVAACDLVGAEQLGDQDADQVGQVRRPLAVDARRGAPRLALLPLLGLQLGRLAVRLVQHVEERLADLLNVPRRVARHVLEHEQQRTHDLQLVLHHPERPEPGAPQQRVDPEPAAEPPVPVLLVADGAEAARERMHHRLPEPGARGGRLAAVAQELVHHGELDLERGRRAARHVAAVHGAGHGLQHGERERLQMPLRQAGGHGHLAPDLGAHHVRKLAEQEGTHLLAQLRGARRVEERDEHPAQRGVLLAARVDEQHGGGGEQVECLPAHGGVRVRHVAHRQVHGREQVERLPGAVQLQLDARRGGAGVVQRGGQLQEAPVAPAELAEDAHRGVRVLVVVRQRAQVAPEGGHDLGHEGRHDRVEELLGEVVDAQLERAEPLAHQLGGGLQREHEWAHELVQVRQEHAEPHGHREAQVHEDVAGPVLRGVQQRVELLEQHGQEREHVLVEQLEAPAADGPEERAEQHVVVARLLGAARVAQRVHDERGEVRLEHRLVLLGEDGDRHEGHLEQPQAHRRRLLVRRAELLEARHEELEQDLGEPPRHGVVREQVLRDAQQHGRGEHAVKEQRQVRGEHLVERLVAQLDEHVGEEVDRVLLLAPVALLLQHAALDAAEQQAAGHLAVRLRGAAVPQHGDQRLEAEEQVAEEEPRVLEGVPDALQHQHARLHGLGLLDADQVRNLPVAGVRAVPQLAQHTPELLQLRQLVQERAEDALQDRHRVLAVLEHDGLDQVEQQLDAHGLDARRERRVVQQLRMHVHHPHDLLRAQLLPHVVHQVRKHAHHERALHLLGGDARAEQHALVEQRVDLPDEVLAEVGREDVPRGDEQLLARRGVLRRAVLEQAHVHLGQQLAILPHDGRRAAQHVREERHRLHLGGDHLAEHGPVPDPGRDADKDLAALPRLLVCRLLRRRLQHEALLKDERHKHVDRRAHHVAVRLEDEHNRDGALGEHLEARRGGEQLARRRGRRRVAALAAERQHAGVARLGRGVPGAVATERLGHRPAHVHVELLHQLQERLHLPLQHRLERPVQVDDHLERHRRVLLVVFPHGAQHHLHERLGVCAQRLVLGVSVDRLDDAVPQPLLGRVRHEHARRGAQQLDLHRHHGMHEGGKVDVDEHLNHLLDLGHHVGLLAHVHAPVREPARKRRCIWCIRRAPSRGVRPAHTRFFATPDRGRGRKARRTPPPPLFRAHHVTPASPTDDHQPGRWGHDGQLAAAAVQQRLLLAAPSTLLVRTGRRRPC